VDIGFKAGGYMQIDIPAYNISFSEFDVEEEYRDAWDGMNLWRYTASIDEPIFRAYSCSTAPYEKGVIKFTIRIATPPPWAPDVSPGLGSTYLWNLKPGDDVTLSGPYGEFFVKETDKEMCFIGGGAGMAPMRSHIFDQLNAVHTDRKITFWYGARSFREMFFDDEFKELQEKNPNFSYNVALSEPQPEDNWEGMTGFIHQALYDNYLANHEDPTEIEYYLCGPPPMIDAVVRMLDDMGVEEENILYDKF
jgi:Na+-transporting NADH:ubiquinone oxidoreductase subunit F